MRQASIGPLFAAASLLAVFWQAFLIRDQIRQDKVLTEEQFKLIEEEIDALRDERYWTRRTQLIDALYARVACAPDPSGDDTETLATDPPPWELNCPHVASHRAREEAVKELVRLERSRGKVAELRRVDLSYLDLRHADLAGARFRYAKFIRTQLQKADLTGTFLYNADMTGANILDADFTKAEMNGMRSPGFRNAKGGNAVCPNAERTFWVSECKGAYQQRKGSSESK